MTDRSPDERSDIDRLLRAALADDLPAPVEDRLNRQVERFLASRHSRRGQTLSAWLASWQAGVGLRLAASAALLVCGILLHAWGGAPVFASSVGRMQESVALWKAIRSSPWMDCGARARDDLGRPADFADRVYRRWVLVASDDTAADATALTFRSPADLAQYELVVDRQSMLPRRVVKTPVPAVTPVPGAAAGYDTQCRWGRQAPKE